MWPPWAIALPWAEVKFRFDLSESLCICFDASWQEEHKIVKITSLAFLLNALFTFSVTWSKRRANAETHSPDLRWLHWNVRKPGYYHSHYADMTLIRASFVFPTIWSLFIFADFTFVQRLLYLFVYVTLNENRALKYQIREEPLMLYVYFVLPWPVDPKLLTLAKN